LGIECRDPGRTGHSSAFLLGRLREISGGLFFIMNKTKIEWCDYTINPIKGLCLYACPYCYARKMYKRFHWKEEVTLRLDELNKIEKIKEPSRIFLCSTHDLFGDWIPDKWIFDIITECHRYPQHTFLLLTKNPKRYLDFTFRGNFWLGQTVIKKEDYKEISNDNIKFVSFEPLLDEEIGNYRFPTDWYIVGGLTPTPKHSHAAIDKILSQASYFNTPVFIKHNAHYPKIRQEFPKGLKTNGKEPAMKGAE
jgi:protein gp37